MSNKLSKEVIKAIKHAAANLSLDAMKAEEELLFAKEEISQLTQRLHEIETNLRAYKTFLGSVETAEEANNEQG